ncbi:fluoride efflux transporter CrcB [Ramlibacter sp. PS3R-8]|uniref:fluoride efflux transporter CrcB n=1 Tax=Ramlibacter sp. PS3R-8 TaxID=3133437 RepID=UPI003096B3F5
MTLPVLAIAAGASLGALLRWQLGRWLNALAPSIPPGTLAANLVGGYLIGVALAFFAQHPGLSPEWRLFVITGFLGGLTTFSTFSAEVVDNIMQGQLASALAVIALHLAGSLTLTALGIATVSGLRRASGA